MKLNLNLEQDTNKEKRVKAARQKKADASYCPTLSEVFIEGWITKTGKRKKPIRELKNSDNDKKKITDVYEALNNNVLGLDGISTKDISKTTVINVLYPRLVAIKKDEMIRHLIDTAPKNYHCVNDMTELSYMLNCMVSEEIIAVDTETTGVTHDDVIVGYSISCPKADQHFYVPFRHETGERMLPSDVCMNAIKPFLEDDRVLKVLHNVKFDHEKFLYDEYSINMVNFVDTMVLMYVLNENEESFALKKLATKYGKHFGFEDKSDTYEELFGKGGFENTPINVGYIYACKDTHLTWSLYRWQLAHLSKQPKLWHIAFDIEMPLIPVLLKMQYRGYRIDMIYAEEYKDELQHEIYELEQQLADYFPEINLNSNQQLAEYLYGTLGLSDNHNGSVDKDALKELAPHYKGIEILLNYRKLTKLLSTYIEPLPQKVWDDGFLHGEFDQIGTKTLRMASRNPNMQNLDPKARRLFLAPEGKMYVSMDWSKLEVFIACEYSNDPNLYEALHSGADVYSALASKAFDKPISECGDGSVYRKHAKTALLGVMYGSSAFTMGKQLDISAEEAQGILDTFFEGYPILAQAIDKNHRLIDKQGYVETLQGSKRRFPDIPQKVKMLNHLDQLIKQKTGKTGTQWSEELGGIYKCKRIPYDLRSKWYSISKDIGRAYRQSFNASIQGSGGLLSKMVIIQVQKYFDELNHKIGSIEYYIIGQVHDELILEIPLDTPRDVLEHIEYLMCNPMPMKCHLKVDTELFKRYYMDGLSKKEFYEEGIRWDDNGKSIC